MGLGSNEVAAAEFLLRYEAVRLLSNDPTDEGGTRTLQQACVVCLAFPPHTPYFLCSGWSMAVICEREVPVVRVGLGTMEQEHHLDSDKGINLGTRRMALCRSVLWERNWPSIAR